MKFCKACRRALERKIINAKIVFVCSICGEIEDGTDEDALIMEEFIGRKESADVYQSILKTAPYDQATQLVDKKCEKCGRPYMSMMRVGDAERVIYLCKCGARIDA